MIKCGNIHKAFKQYLAHNEGLESVVIMLIIMSGGNLCLLAVFSHQLYHQALFK